MGTLIFLLTLLPVFSRSMGIGGVARVRGHTFFGSCIGRDSLVLDLGANDGQFALEMAERFGARCFAVEASPILFEQFPRHPRVRVWNLAIAAEDKMLDFNLSPNPESSSLYRPAAVACGTESPGHVQVRGCRFETFLARYEIDQIDLLKVDIEGAEVDLFRTTSDQTLKRIRQITIEFHDFCGLISEADVGAIRSRLEALGFYGIAFARTNGDWLFIQPMLCGIGHTRLRIVKYFVRNMLGLARMVQRWLGRGTV